MLSQESDIPYNIFLFTLGFFIPLVTILLTSLEVIIKLRRQTNSIINRDIRDAATERQVRVTKMVYLKLT